MKARHAAPGLIALALLAGCGGKSAPTAAPSASSTASAPASPAPAPSAAAPVAAASPAAPLIKAASYPPRDDCAGLPDWADFRAKLEQAVARRDAAALAALTDPAVKLDFGGGYGVTELKKRLTDKEYRLWDEIAAVLPLGCSSSPVEGQGKSASMPWIFEKSPQDVDPYAAKLVLGPSVPAYAKPSSASSVIGTLDWALVTVQTYPEPGKPLAKVTLPDGKSTAFVETAKLRSIIDYRVQATRGKNGWRIDAIIGGD